MESQNTPRRNWKHKKKMIIMIEKFLSSVNSYLDLRSELYGWDWCILEHLVLHHSKTIRLVMHIHRLNHTWLNTAHSSLLQCRINTVRHSLLQKYVWGDFLVAYSVSVFLCLHLWGFLDRDFFSSLFNCPCYPYFEMLWANYGV